MMLKYTTLPPTPSNSVSVTQKQNKKHVVASHRRALLDFHQTSHGGRGGPCHHFAAQLFSGAVNSLAASGKKPKKQPLNP